MHIIIALWIKTSSVALYLPGIAAEAMRLSKSWFVIILVHCLTTRTVTPQGTGPEKERLSISTNTYKEFHQPPNGTVIAVTDHETIVKTEDTLYLLKSEEETATTTILSEKHLRHTQPTDVQAVSFEGTVYVTINHDGEVHLYKYKRNASKGGLHHVRYRLPDYYAYPPTSNVIISIHVRDNTYLYIYMVYYSETNGIISYDIHNTIQRHFFDLPFDCSCNHAQCLSSFDNYQGQAIVNCADGKRYLFNIYEEELFLIPKHIHHFVTSNNDRKSAVAVLHFEDINQDLLLILHFRDDNEQPMTAAIPHHEGIQDIAIAPVNNVADKEIVYILSSNSTLEYFLLPGIEKSPVTNILSLPPNVTIGRFGGVTNSSLAILVTSFSRTFLTLASVILTDQVQKKNATVTESGVQPTQTISISNESNSIQPTMTTVLPSINESEFIHSMADTNTIAPQTALPTENIPTSIRTSGEENKGPGIAVIIVVTVFLVLIILFIIFTRKKCKQHQVL